MKREIEILKLIPPPVKYSIPWNALREIVKLIEGSKDNILTIDDYDDPCPDCGKQLKMSNSGGVYCSCGYWFCY